MRLEDRERLFETVSKYLSPVRLYHIRPKTELAPCVVYFIEKTEVVVFADDKPYVERMVTVFDICNFAPYEGEAVRSGLRGFMEGAGFNVVTEDGDKKRLRCFISY